MLVNRERKAKEVKALQSSEEFISKKKFLHLGETRNCAIRLQTAKSINKMIQIKVITF